VFSILIEKYKVTSRNKKGRNIREKQ